VSTKPAVVKSKPQAPTTFIEDDLDDDDEEWLTNIKGKRPKTSLAAGKRRPIPPSNSVSSVPKQTSKFFNSQASMESTGSDSKAEVTATCGLSAKQKSLLVTWLSGYRRRFPGSYWNYIGNVQLTELSDKVPCLIDDLYNITGFGSKKITDYGQEVLGTIWAFLDANDLLGLFPNARKPIIKESPIWMDPLSDAADQARQALHDEEELKRTSNIFSSLEKNSVSTSTPNTRLSYDPQQQHRVNAPPFTTTQSSPYRADSGSKRPFEHSFQQQQQQQPSHQLHSRQAAPIQPSPVSPKPFVHAPSKIPRTDFPFGGGIGHGDHDGRDNKENDFDKEPTRDILDFLA
jgi:hypothetical protein